MPHALCLVLLIAASCIQAVTITKLPLPGAYQDAIVGVGKATFLTSVEAARVRRQQSRDVLRTSYNADGIPGESNGRDTGFYSGEDRRQSLRGGPGYVDKNQYNGNGGRDDGERRDYYPVRDSDGDGRKYNDPNDIPRVVFVEPRPRYPSTYQRGPDGQQGGDPRRGPNDYQGSDNRRGPNDYQGSDNRRGPNDNQGRDSRRGPNDYQGNDSRRGPNDYQGRDNRRGPNDYQGSDSRRGPNEYQGNDSRRGPNEYHGNENRRGPPEAYPGHDQRRGNDGYRGNDNGRGPYQGAVIRGGPRPDDYLGDRWSGPPGEVGRGSDRAYNNYGNDGRYDPRIQGGRDYGGRDHGGNDQGGRHSGQEPPRDWIPGSDPGRENTKWDSTRRNGNEDGFVPRRDMYPGRDPRENSGWDTRRIGNEGYPGTPGEINPGKDQRNRFDVVDRRGVATEDARRGRWVSNCADDRSVEGGRDCGGRWDRQAPAPPVSSGVEGTVGFYGTARRE